MRKIACLFVIGLFLWMPYIAIATDVPVSDATAECIECHSSVHPSIVESWQQSQHAKVTPQTAMAVNGLARKVSSKQVSDDLLTRAVGCAECHTQRSTAHTDTFEHNGYDVHVVVSPKDCAICHAQEADQYSKNIMAHAFNNLAANPVYHLLQNSILGTPEPADEKKGSITIKPPNDATKAEACYYCHGTQLSVKGYETRDTEAAGELEFPIIEGWPNQGVGRINLDGSRGSCSACHTRHTFSIKMARKPYTCKECHTGPDVPAFKVYAASKHGNIFSSMNESWNFDTVPWTIGQDFTAPTCAACHVSLLINTDGEVVAERTHQMNSRLPWRIFGLIYAHPHPKEPDTTTIRNKNGQSLPTAFDGEFAAKYLITEKEMNIRKENMQAVCLSCHAATWVNGQWARFENTIQETNTKTLRATNIMNEIWHLNLADFKWKDTGPAGNPFDEAIEKKWSNTWLIYGNHIRFASAMGCGGDYGVFANGRYDLSKTFMEMADWLKARKRIFIQKGQP
ncbi:MAG: hydroxylamine oxidase [Desulfobacterales bacterium]|nr:MAG: hydroxylamine oxidase [Desulfobacterales bacterium]